MDHQLAGTSVRHSAGAACAALVGWRLVAHDAARGWIRVGFEVGRSS